MLRGFIGVKVVSVWTIGSPNGQNRMTLRLRAVLEPSRGSLADMCWRKCVTAKLFFIYMAASPRSNSLVATWFRSGEGFKLTLNQSVVCVEFLPMLAGLKMPAKVVVGNRKMWLLQKWHDE